MKFADWLENVDRNGFDWVERLAGNDVDRTTQYIGFRCLADDTGRFIIQAGFMPLNHESLQRL